MKRIKSALLSLVIILCGVPQLAAEVYGTIIYAEGSSFRLVRNGTSRQISVDSNEVFGMEVIPGDIFQTASQTMLELGIREAGAVVKIAENTSFRCDREPKDNRTTGELYYGRVRAKVTRLARGSTYRITSPSLVAGVRGTDFGLDVIAFRRSPDTGVQPVAADGAVSADTGDPEYTVNDGDATVLHRVFCFDGSVLVGDFSGPELETVVLTAGEKVERLVLAGTAETGPLEKMTIDSEIRAFWDSRPFKGIEAGIIPVEDEGVRDVPARKPRFAPERSAGHLRVPGTITATLMVLGSSALVSAAVLDSMTSDDWMVRAAHTSGCIMIGSGTVVTLLSLIGR